MAWPFWLARFGPALGKILWERSKKLLGSALTKWEYKRIGLQIARQAKKNKWSLKRIQDEVETLEHRHTQNPTEQRHREKFSVCTT